MSYLYCVNVSPYSPKIALDPLASSLLNTLACKLLGYCSSIVTIFVSTKIIMAYSKRLEAACQSLLAVNDMLLIQCRSGYTSESLLASDRFEYVCNLVQVPVRSSAT